MQAETRYVASGDVHIAYQVVGEGPLDVVFVPPWLSHVEHLWQEPRLARFLSGLTAFARLILFDRRGTGLSDGTGGASTLDEQIDDVRAVLDAVGSENPALLSVAEGGAMATLFAATHPDLVRALVLYTPMAAAGQRAGLRVGGFPGGARRDAYGRSSSRGDAGRTSTDSLRAPPVTSSCGAGSRPSNGSRWAPAPRRRISRWSARSTCATSCRASSARRS